MKYAKIESKKVAIDVISNGVSDEVVKDQLPRIIESFFGDKKSFNGVIVDIMHTIMFWTMNADLAVHTDDICGGKIDVSDTEDYAEYLSHFPVVQMCTKAEVSQILNNTNLATVVTARAWEKDVRPRNRITARGFTFVLGGEQLFMAQNLLWANEQGYTGYNDTSANKNLWVSRRLPNAAEPEGAGILGDMEEDPEGQKRIEEELARLQGNTPPRPPPNTEPPKLEPPKAEEK